MKNLISTKLPTKFGLFDLWVWAGERGREPVALSTPGLDPTKEVSLRIHSECLTGDTFSSLSCDCGQQKDEALKIISEHGNGIFIYHRQEGRNLGLFKKIQAYNFLLKGLDTHEANIRLSGEPDGRDYSECLKILEQLLGQKSPLLLLTNNPYKKLILERAGYQVSVQPLRIEPNFHNKNYFLAKEQKFSHYNHGQLPYVGVTLWPKDLESRSKEIARLVNSTKISGRKIFLGLAIFPKNGDLKNQTLIKLFNKFAAQTKTANLVLHLDYHEQRQFHRDLKKFLESLNFRPSIQFRLPEGDKIDLEIIDSLKKDAMIFQIKSDQFWLLENPEFVEYFQKTNRYLLLDNSFGTGTETDFGGLKKNVMAAIDKGLSHLAVAGGFHAGNLDKIFALEDYFKIPFSVDAENGLRSNKTIDLEKMKKYLRFFSFGQRDG